MAVWEFDTAKKISTAKKMESSKALVQIVFDSYSPKDIKFERSLNGEDWTTAFEIKSYSKKVFDTTLVNGGNGLYIRATTSEAIDSACIELNP